MKYKKTIKDSVKYNPQDDYSEVEEITGYLNCRGADTKAAFSKLTTVGGYLYCEGYTGTFDKLTTVGGYLDCRDYTGTFDKLKNRGNSEFAKQKVNQAFRRKGFLFADDILSKIVSTKKTTGGVLIHTVVIVGKSKRSYCIEADGFYSHGDTIKEARESLLYKVGERDKSAYEKWTLKTKVTKKQAIESYRVITGACEAGVRHFVGQHGKLKSKYTIEEIIKITKGQYGNSIYRDFFNGQTK